MRPFRYCFDTSTNICASVSWGPLAYLLKWNASSLKWVWVLIRRLCCCHSTCALELCFAAQTLENATACDWDQRSRCTQQQELVLCKFCPFLLCSLVVYYASKNTRQSVGVKRFVWRLFVRATAKNSAVQSSLGLHYVWNMKSQTLALAERTAVPLIIKI